MKMLKPKVVGEYAQQLHEVATDLLTQAKETRGTDGIVPGLQQELFKWSLECELILIIFINHKNSYLYSIYSLDMYFKRSSAEI